MKVRTAANAGTNRRGELVVLSNRLPYTVSAGVEGPTLTPAVSGLVTAVEPVLRRTGGVWIGWGGRTTHAAGAGPLVLAPPEGAAYSLQEVLFPEQEFRAYYHGFANAGLWPLCHHFVERASFDPTGWQAYVAANRRFTQATLPWAKTGRLVWVHDFHLALVPRQLRSGLPGVRIAFFWHIPFPPYELLATLPWARELLAGLLGSNLIAFHTQDYVHNFLRSAERLLGAEVDLDRGQVTWQGRTVQVQALPIGVDWQEFQTLARKPEVQERARAIRAAAGTPVVMLGVERLDYTKGIPERLRAFDHLLEQHPELKGQVTLLQIGVPTRDGVPAYRELRRRVEEAVGRVNGKHTEGWHSPVRYQARGFSREDLVAHYLAADVGLVTPLRDGLNLVAKEYVASRVDGRGVLLLSPFAGAAADLPEALPGNPYNTEELAEAMRVAITMPEAEQRRRMAALQDRVRERDLAWWWKTTLQVLAGVSHEAAPETQAAGLVGSGLRTGARPALEVTPGGSPAAAGSRQN